MKMLLVLGAVATQLLFFGPLMAQTYKVYISVLSGPCGRTATDTYTLTVKGKEITGVHDRGSGFTAPLNDDGSFRATFESWNNRTPMLAEGTVSGGKISLKVTNTRLGCVWEGKL